MKKTSVNTNADLECAMLNSKSVRTVLRAWDSTKRLNTHPLTKLKLVKIRQQAEGYFEMPNSKGSALRETLRAAIEALRPNTGSPNSEEKCWRAYIILTKQFLHGRAPECIATDLNISRRQFYDEQEQAIERLVEVLGQSEARATLEQMPILGSLSAYPAATIQSANTTLFMAPPRPSHTLIGRDDLLREIKAWLLNNHALALGAFHGLPGVGKTALAIELAHDPEIQTRFNDGILWVDLGRQPDILTSLVGWALALNVPLERIARCTNLTEYARLIHTAIGLRRMLLVIDDAWQLDDALAFKVGGPNCAYLVTTRLASIAMDFAGERTITLRELSNAEGLSLLTQLAPEVALAEPQEALALVQKVGGLPLPLILIGGYLRRQSHAGQVRRLRQALLMLREAETRLKLTQPKSPLEQQSTTSAEWLSLQASISLSDGALDVVTRQALRDLALFPSKPNTFSEEAALTVAAAPTGVLDTLVDYGLVECLEKDRYTLHQAIADYAHYTQTIATAPDRDTASPTAISRFVNHFTHSMADQIPDANAFDVERQNLLTALELALKYQLWEEFVQGMNALYSFLMNCGLYLETTQYLSNVLALIPRTRHAERYLLLIARERAYHALGRREAQRQDLEALEELVESLDDQRHRAEVALWRAAYAQTMGDHAAGIASAQKAIAWAQAIPDLTIQAISYFLLGLMQRAQGDYAGARVYFEQALCLHRELSDRQSESEVLLFLGLVCEDQHDQVTAQVYFEQARCIAGKSSRRLELGESLANLGGALQEQRYYSSAQCGLGYTPNFF